MFLYLFVTVYISQFSAEATEITPANIIDSTQREHSHPYRRVCSVKAIVNLTRLFFSDKTAHNSNYLFPSHRLADRLIISTADIALRC